MATPDPRARAVLRAYRSATQRSGEQREALWSRIEASLDARAPGLSVEPESGREPRSRTEPRPVRAPGWTTPVIVAAVAVAAAVVAAIALGPGERRRVASQSSPWAAPHEAAPGESFEAARRRAGAADSAQAAAMASRDRASAATNHDAGSPSHAVAVGHDAVTKHDAGSLQATASADDAPTMRDADSPHVGPGSDSAPTDAGPSRRPTRSDAPAPREVEAPVAPGSPTEVDELRAEMALVREARQALQADRPAGALEVLDAHARAFPEGQMREDRAVLRIEALCAVGKGPQARAEAKQFLRAFPRSAHAERVRATCAEP